MKTQTHKFWIKTVLAVAVLGLVACAKNESSPQPQPIAPVIVPGPNISGCQNCFPGGAMMLQNAQASHSLLGMGVDIYGNSANGQNFGDPKVILSYNGPVYVEAYMQLYQNSLCGAPAGEYRVNTIQAGNAMLGVLYGLQLQAVGPAQLILNVSQATVYNGTDFNGVTRDSQNNRLNLRMYIASVNGQNCGYLDPVETY